MEKKNNGIEDKETLYESDGEKKSNFEILELQFVFCKEESWGITSALEEFPWKIHAVNPEMQFGKKGVEKGWIFLAIDDEEITENNRETMKELLRNGTACKILFGTSRKKTMQTNVSIDIKGENKLVINEMTETIEKLSAENTVLNDKLNELANENESVQGLLKNSLDTTEQLVQQSEKQNELLQIELKQKEIEIERLTENFKSLLKVKEDHIDQLKTKFENEKQVLRNELENVNKITVDQLKTKFEEEKQVLRNELENVNKITVDQLKTKFEEEKQVLRNELENVNKITVEQLKNNFLIEKEVLENTNKIALERLSLLEARSIKKTKKKRVLTKQKKNFKYFKLTQTKLRILKAVKTYFLQISNLENKKKYVQIEIEEETMECQNDKLKELETELSDEKKKDNTSTQRIKK
jgi:hypothetical protein